MKSTRLLSAPVSVCCGRHVRPRLREGRRRRATRNFSKLAIGRERCKKKSGPVSSRQAGRRMSCLLPGPEQEEPAWLRPGLFNPVLMRDERDCVFWQNGGGGSKWGEIKLGPPLQSTLHLREIGRVGLYSPARVGICLTTGGGWVTSCQPVMCRCMFFFLLLWQTKWLE